MSGMMAFLQAEASLGSVGADFLLSAGALHKERRLDHGHGRGRSGTCYETAFGLARQHPELTYCEGRALSLGIVPIEHAWCVDQAGKVVDTTWDPYQTEYMGVSFATPFVAQWVSGRRTYGILAEEFPLELLDIPPESFLASPSPAQLAGAARVLARARELVRAPRSARASAGTDVL